MEDEGGFDVMMEDDVEQLFGDHDEVVTPPSAAVPGSSHESEDVEIISDDNDGSSSLPSSRKRKAKSLPSTSTPYHNPSRISHGRAGERPKDQGSCEIKLYVGPADKQTILYAPKILLESVGYFQRSKRAHEFSLPDLSSDAVNRILDYLWNGSIHIPHKIPKLHELLKAVNKFDFDDLKVKCVELLKKQLSVDNCFTIRRIGIENSTPLLAEVDEFIQQNFERLSSVPEFLGYDINEIENLIKTYLRQPLPPQHTPIFKAMLNWIKKDAPGRKGFLSRLIDLVDLNQILDNDPELINGEFNQEGSVLDSDPKCKELYYKALTKKLDTDIKLGRVTRTKNQHQEVRPEICLKQEKGEEIEISSDTASSSTSPSSKRRRASKPERGKKASSRSSRTLPVNTSDEDDTDIVDDDEEVPKRSRKGKKDASDKASAVPVADDLELGIKIFYLVEEKPDDIRIYDYDFQEKSSTMLFKPKLSRKHGAIVATSNCLYYIGGKANPELVSKSNSSKMVEIFTSGKKSGKGGILGNPLNHEHVQFGSCLWNNKIYVVGGHGVDDTAIDTVEELDVAEKRKSGRTRNPKWELKQSMNTARKGFGMSVFQNRIFVVGGIGESKEPLDTVEIYDPETDTWSAASKINSPRAYLKTVVNSNNDKLYAIGGSYGVNSTKTTNVVEEYNPDVDKWTTMAPMNENRSNFGLFQSNGIIYVIGGNDSAAMEFYDVRTKHWQFMPLPEGIKYNGSLFDTCVVTE